MLTIVDLIAVLSLCLTSFGLGYSIGINSRKTTKKQPPNQLEIMGNYFSHHIKRTVSGNALYILYTSTELCLRQIKPSYREQNVNLPKYFQCPN